MVAGFDSLKPLRDSWKKQLTFLKQSELFHLGSRVASGRLVLKSSFPAKKQPERRMDQRFCYDHSMDLAEKKKLVLEMHSRAEKNHKRTRVSLIMLIIALIVGVAGFFLGVADADYYFRFLIALGLFCYFAYSYNKNKEAATDINNLLPSGKYDGIFHVYSFLLTNREKVMVYESQNKTSAP